ncbi:MAG TPA: site-specific integrase, partial [Urbifossiella sp.]|nr:site-specific integrase [Urbifossiella sp.]
MATLIRPTRPYPLPADAEILDRDGRPQVRLREGGKAVFYPVSKDGAKYLKPSAKWYAKYRDAAGVVQCTPLSPNKDAARLMLTDLIKRVENEKAGVIDRTAAQRKRPLSAHLDDWRGSLAASGRGEEYIALKLSRVRAVVEGCGWTFTPDMAADRLETYLRDLREKDGRSIQTSNDWLQAVRQFCRWMVANDRLGRDPFARLKPGNVKLDQRHRRGEFTPDELARLFRAAGSSPVVYRRTLTGADRVLVYRVALGTGFRAAELAALTPDMFDLDATPPAVVLPPEFSKNRQGAVQPVADNLAADLRGYLRGRPGKEPVWPGKWADRSADMLKLDLAAAGVPVEVDSPEGVEVRDFHALRNCFISDVLRSGADLKQAMTLARHS